MRLTHARDGLVEILFDDVRSSKEKPAFIRRATSVLLVLSEILFGASMAWSGAGSPDVTPWKSSWQVKSGIAMLLANSNRQGKRALV